MGFLEKGVSNDSRVDDSNFSSFWVATSETLDIRPALLHGDMQSLDGLQLIAK